MEKNLRPLSEEEEERAVGEEEPEEMEGAVGGVEHHDDDVERSSMLGQAGSNSNNSNSEAFSSDVSCIDYIMYGVIYVSAIMTAMIRNVLFSSNYLFVCPKHTINSSKLCTDLYADSS